MNAQVKKLFAEYLEMAGGDKAAATNLVLADAMLQRPQAPNPASDALTPAEAATELNMHRETIYRLCRTGELLCFRKGRAIRIRREGIEAIKANTPKIAHRPRYVGFDHLAD